MTPLSPIRRAATQREPTSTAKEVAGGAPGGQADVDPPAAGGEHRRQPLALVHRRSRLGVEGRHRAGGGRPHGERLGGACRQARELLAGGGEPGARGAGVGLGGLEVGQADDPVVVQPAGARRGGVLLRHPLLELVHLAAQLLAAHREGGPVGGVEGGGEAQQRLAGGHPLAEHDEGRSRHRRRHRRADLHLRTRGGGHHAVGGLPAGDVAASRHRGDQAEGAALVLAEQDGAVRRHAHPARHRPLLRLALRLARAATGGENEAEQQGDGARRHPSSIPPTGTRRRRFSRRRPRRRAAARWVAKPWAAATGPAAPSPRIRAPAGRRRGRCWRGAGRRRRRRPGRRPAATP